MFLPPITPSPDLLSQRHSGSGAWQPAFTSPVSDSVVAQVGDSWPREQCSNPYWAPARCFLPLCWFPGPCPMPPHPGATTKLLRALRWGLWHVLFLLCTSPPGSLISPYAGFRIYGPWVFPCPCPKLWYTWGIMCTSPESWSPCLSLFRSVLTVSVQRVRSYSSLLFGLKVQHSAGPIGGVSEYLVSTQLGDWLILQLGKKTQRNLHISQKHVFVCQCFFFFNFQKLFIEVWLIYDVNFCFIAKWFSSKYVCVCVCIYIYIYIFFFIMAYHRILNIVPPAIQ